MASLLSLRFLTPLTSPKTLIKETQPRMADRERFLIPTTSITVINLIAQKSWSGCIFCVKNCHNHILARRRHCSEPVSPLNNVSCTPMVISGFWVGPDVEDGWGFVEALVNRIF